MFARGRSACKLDRILVSMENYIFGKLHPVTLSKVRHSVGSSALIEGEGERGLPLSDLQE